MQCRKTNCSKCFYVCICWRRLRRDVCSGANRQVTINRHRRGVRCLRPHFKTPRVGWKCELTNQSKNNQDPSILIGDLNQSLERSLLQVEYLWFSLHRLVCGVSVSFLSPIRVAKWVRLRCYKNLILSIQIHVYFLRYCDKICATDELNLVISLIEKYFCILSP